MRVVDAMNTWPNQPFEPVSLSRLLGAPALLNAENGSCAGAASAPARRDADSAAGQLSVTLHSARIVPSGRVATSDNDFM